MHADVPLGAFLSGGLDSSTIVALMQAQSTKPVQTFTIGFYESRYNEAQNAKAVAHHLGTEHTELYVRPEEAMAVIPRLATLYDEPFADSSQIPTFLISQLARRHVTVSLSGDAGDELFAGYDRYFLGHTHLGQGKPNSHGTSELGRQRFEDDLTRVYGKPSSGDCDRCSPDRLKMRNPRDKLGRLAELLMTDSREALYLSLVSHWKAPASLIYGAKEPQTLLTDPGQWANLPEFTQRMMYLDMVTYLPDDILVKVDRASMGVGLEARVPFLDHRVVEFAWQIPLIDENP